MRLLRGFNIIIISLALILPVNLLAQDLNCDVIINADQIQTSDRRVFQDMETAIENFMNGRDWTPDEFKVEERIKCNISINLAQ